MCNSLYAGFPFSLFSLQLLDGCRFSGLVGIKFGKNTFVADFEINKTGAVAASRIVFENWSVETAISELMQPQYGHHKYIYTNIPALLRKADWQKIKTTVLNGKK